ncbi:alpha/beta-hydrolase [Xylaria bambusicola]|uniref:alpha/beta-hydrolase n=1 Tax=Xylaria bambusicola TaxID=326684 RepID=UPI0020077B55|nr:alpha/beta-hydrolase [Xylaria bambusicola]KAI0521615.1 alpha/beta-hydrolase [Xylaria bambusicola]
MSSSPTLVFVHGSWHQPSCYNKITEILQGRHGLKCVSPALPSTAGNPDATFKDDIDVIRRAILREVNAGTDVVVIAHSYGGMVGNSAIKGFARSREEPASATGHVVGLILIASGFTFTGLAFMDPFLGRPPPSWRVNRETGYAEIVMSPREMFYHDLPADEADYWVSQLTTQSLKSLFEGGEFAYAGWMDVPSFYIGTIEDRGLPVAMQRMSVGMARGVGASVEHRELQTSHSPFLSRPEETAEIIWEAVQAFTGRPVERARTNIEENHEILIPRVRLLQPLTWYRFGLPLAFGHFLGRCYTIFRGARRLFGFR